MDELRTRNTDLETSMDHVREEVRTQVLEYAICAMHKRKSRTLLWKCMLWWEDVVWARDVSPSRKAASCVPPQPHGVHSCVLLQPHDVHSCVISQPHGMHACTDNNRDDNGASAHIHPWKINHAAAAAAAAEETHDDISLTLSTTCVSPGGNSTVGSGRDPGDSLGREPGDSSPGDSTLASERETCILTSGSEGTPVKYASSASGSPGTSRHSAPGSRHGDDNNFINSTHDEASSSGSPTSAVAWPCDAVSQTAEDEGFGELLPVGVWSKHSSPTGDCSNVFDATCVTPKKIMGEGVVQSGEDDDLC
jgi:hypothetical protein